MYNRDQSFQILTEYIYFAMGLDVREVLLTVAKLAFDKIS
jgi:hypothetical protein